MIDLDELDADIKDSIENGLIMTIPVEVMEAFAKELRELRKRDELAREVIGAAIEWDDAVASDNSADFHRLQLKYKTALRTYNQHTEGKDTSGGIGE